MSVRSGAISLRGRQKFVVLRDSSQLGGWRQPLVPVLCRGYDSIITGVVIALAPRRNSGIARDGFGVEHRVCWDFFSFPLPYRLSVSTASADLHSGVLAFLAEPYKGARTARVPGNRAHQIVQIHLHLHLHLRQET